MIVINNDRKYNKDISEIIDNLYIQTTIKNISRNYTTYLTKYNNLINKYENNKDLNNIQYSHSQENEYEYYFYEYYYKTKKNNNQ